MDQIELDAKIIFTHSKENFTGSFQIALPSGKVWKPQYFEFHLVLDAHFWLSLSIEEAIERHKSNQPQLVQDVHKAYMQSKYPGWPHQYLEPKHRPAQEPAEKIDASHLNVGDLDL